MADLVVNSIYKRNLVGFWILGLTNNFAYVIMLSAATAILQDHSETGNSSSPNTTVAPPNNRSGNLLPYCNTIGTGAVLLADIIPTLIVKLSAPFYMHKISYRTRVILIIAFGATSFPIVATSNHVWLSIIGIVFASLGAGFGEITFLSMSTHFHKNVVSTWSSGTGGAGLFGSLSYLGLTSAGLSPQNTLLVMLVIPVLMFVTYFFILVIPPSAREATTIRARREDDRMPIIDPEDDLYASEESVSGRNKSRAEIFSLDGNIATRQESGNVSSTGSNITGVQQDSGSGSPSEGHSNQELIISEELTLRQKLNLIVPLLRYMIPLALVYFGEYFINQALFELVYFLGIWLPWHQQYVWYQAIYQLGVFISRSSVNLFRIRHIWIMPILQFGNAAFLLCQIYFQFVPSIWIIFLIILFEGLLGGATYVNCFYMITEEVELEHREFSMGFASLADSSGITLAGVIAVPVHNAICSA